VFQPSRDREKSLRWLVTEELPFSDPWAGYTKRLAAEVGLFCRETRSLKAIAAQYDLDWKTVCEQPSQPAVGVRLFSTW